MLQGCNPQAGHVTSRASGGNAQPKTSQQVTSHCELVLHFRGSVSHCSCLKVQLPGTALRYVNDIGAVAEQVCCFYIEGVCHPLSCCSHFIGLSLGCAEQPPP